MKFDNVLQTVGRTPVVRLNSFTDHLARELWVKLESFNPAGSVKDRPALNMIEDAEQRGVLNPGDTIIEPTSGNTGIGLAMVAAVKGYRAIFVMSEDMSSERKQILLAYGAELVLTPADKGTIGAIEEARRLSEEKGYFFVGQHYNPANPAAHQITANEIYEDFGEKLDAIVCTTGTGGTISGLSTYLKDRIPDLMIIATEPEDSPILSKGIACKHKIMGTAPGFIPDTLWTNQPTTTSYPSPLKRPFNQRANWLLTRASFAASPAAQQSRACSTMPQKKVPVALSYWPFCQTLESATSVPTYGPRSRESV